MYLVRETFFIVKCVCLGASINTFLLEIAFPSNLQYTKLQNFLPISLSHSGPSDDSKMSKFLHTI